MKAEFLLSEEFLGFSAKIAELHKAKKDQEAEFKRLFTEHKSKLKALDEEALYALADRISAEQRRRYAQKRKSDNQNHEDFKNSAEKQQLKEDILQLKREFQDLPIKAILPQKIHLTVEIERTDDFNQVIDDNSLYIWANLNFDDGSTTGCLSLDDEIKDALTYVDSESLTVENLEAFTSEQVQFKEFAKKLAEIQPRIDAAANCGFGVSQILDES